MSKYTTLALSRIGKANNIAHIELNRAAKGNAMNATFFEEFTDIFKSIATDTSYRATIVSAKGKYFSVGLDLKDNPFFHFDEKAKDERDFSRKTFEWYNRLLGVQNVVNSMERCPQPIIFCMHSYVIGGGVNLACGADIRYCSEDTQFSVKEIDIGISADIGALQRLEKQMGSSSLVRELCFTGRNLSAEEAKSSGFVSSVFKSQEECVSHGISIAEMIAEKSPVGVTGTKMVLNYSRDNTVGASLQFQAAWNASMNQAKDVEEAAISSATKAKPPSFPNL